MNCSRLRAPATLSIAALITFAFAGIGALAQLAPNQTQGFGNNRLVTFTSD